MSRERVTADGRRFLETSTFAPALINPERSWMHILDALKDAFPHLNWVQIDKPPLGYFDATLVRQIGFYIFCIKMGVPKKRAVVAARMSADGKWRSFNRIANRMNSLCFRNHVEMILADAERRIEEDLRK